MVDRLLSWSNKDKIINSELRMRGWGTGDRQNVIKWCVKGNEGIIIGKDGATRIIGMRLDEAGGIKDQL